MKLAKKIVIGLSIMSMVQFANASDYEIKGDIRYRYENREADELLKNHGNVSELASAFMVISMKLSRLVRVLRQVVMGLLQPTKTLMVQQPIKK